jgi:Cu(I)/Ag(I) efflux system membrane fusion protein
MSTSEQPTQTPTQPAPSGSGPHPAPRPRRWWIQKLVSAGLVLAVGLTLIASVGVAQRLGWIRAGGGAAVSASGGADAQAIHTCPMHPQIRQPGPGRCPICGMELVPAASGSADLDEYAVHIEPAQRRLANIKTDTVRRDSLSDTIRTVGAIAIDESRMATIPSYIDGRIERLFADYTGVDVKEGDHLAVVYSPELYAAQVEYVESRNALAKLTAGTLAIVKQTQEKLVASSRQKLVELGMTEEQLKQLEDSGEPLSRLTIYSPIGGTVTEKLAVEGKYVKAGEPIYRIANLSTVWLMLELYPEDAARIRFGQRVEAEMQSLPGTTFDGRVAFIDRVVDPQKRTVGVRVEFLNEDRALRPGDYAQATIFLAIGEQGEVYDAGLAGRWISPMHPQIIRDEPGDCPICGMDLVPTTRYGYSETPVEQPTSLYVPRSALLMAGSNSVVYVESEPGRFEIRPVTPGPILRDRVVILGGLKEGEAVATAGNFLIDSQMQLAGKPSLIDPSKAVARQNERKVPLEFERIEVAAIAGQSGATLEQLFAAYFEIQKALAGDTKPAMQPSMSLNKAAETLSQDEAFSAEIQQQFDSVAKQTEHLHHMELAAAREAFKPVSHIVVTLATQYRGEKATQPFTHFFCPMVKGGGGDWLQLDEKLLNPYWGSQMLHCGEKVHGFPAIGTGNKRSNIYK